MVGYFVWGIILIGIMLKTGYQKIGYDNHLILVFV